MLKIISFLVLTAFSGATLADDNVILITQKDRKFQPVELTAKVGDTLRFKNDDPFFHNVFSLSEAAVFDLGSYPKGSSKDFKLEKVGTVEVECAIHPDMRMIIKVEK